MDALSLLASGLAVALVAYAVLDTFFSEERRVRSRLSALDSYAVESIAEAEPLAAPFRERILKPGVSRMARAVGSFMPGDYRARVRRRIVTAGLVGRLDPERIILIRLVVGVLAFLAILGAGRGLGGELSRTLVFAAAGALLVSFAPDVYLSVTAAERKRTIVRELPDMLDMLTISVEAGLGFDQAVARYVQHSAGPLGKEFGIALMEIQAGRSRRDALRAMGERIEVAEVRTFVMAIVQADVFGVSVSDVLRTQSREMRVKRRQRAEELAQMAPAKMAFPLIVCILPATLIVVITPAVIGLARLFSGD